MRRNTLAVFFISLIVLLQFPAAAQTNGVRARVSADSGKYYVEVNNLLLDFVFAGYGLYAPGDYPILTEFPLANGEKVRFDRVKEVTFSPERVFWKEYVEYDKRKEYLNVDENGYRHWSEIEVNVRLVDWENNFIHSRLKRPESSDIYLRGETSRGELELQVDQENGKKVHIIFRPNFVMQCTGEKSHLFPNSAFKYCPICGKPLIKWTPQNIQKETTR
ncbi:hypothetical protein EH223_18535 [candidate division KSB1 bacterium]|nr:hypothetical protein [candidate division KSB1 bacterium]RQW00483.1 MAG: hypothetical protein EH223_18535 [candidate division KSB1 bacterium]